MTSPPADHLALLQSGVWFSSLPEPFQNELLACARIRRLAPGQRLFARGDKSDGLYAVLSGGMRITTVGSNGREAILAIVEPPQWFGEIAVFDDQLRTHDAWAESQCLLLNVPERAVRDCLQREPSYWQDLGRLMTQKMRLLFQAMEDAALLAPSERLARRLVGMAQGYGHLQHRDGLELRIPQEQLGMMVSLSRQTVNQILRRFEQDGLLRLQRGSITLLNLHGLKVQAGLTTEHMQALIPGAPRAP